MTMNYKRILGLLVCMVVFVLQACAQGNITVTSPSSGDVLGLSNNVTFNTTGTVKTLTVTLTLTGPGGTITKSQQFTAPADGKVTGSIPLNLTTSTQEGTYSLAVTTSEAGNTYNTVAPINVTVLVTAPKFLEFSPIDGAFVKGQVTISFTLQSTALKQWTVQVNSNDIPNNSGTSLTGSVIWDTTSIQNDGAQTITITATDKAGNTATRSINVTLSRVGPQLTVQAPRSDLPIVPGSNISVIVDVKSTTSAQVSFTGVDVVVKTIDGAFITRVPRISFKATGSNSNRWTGRIRGRVRLPKMCKLVVTCIDNAGNAATPQEVALTVG